MKKRLVIAALVSLAALMVSMPAQAQTKLKFAHVYETTEAFHKEAVWAAGEIAKRTNNKYTIDVFPASSLGNEQQITQAMPLGTIDMAYIGASFVGATYKPISIVNGPYMWRDFDHWKAYSQSPLLTELTDGYFKQTGNKIVALTYYGARHTTANKAINVPADMKGMKLRVPQAPMYMMYARAMGANPTPIAFAEVYLALQNGTVDGQENPLPTIQAKKFYEVQSHINLTGHILDNLTTVIGSPLWKRLTPQEQQIFESVFKEASTRAGASIRESEAKLADWFKQQGKTVVVPDLKAFREAAVKIHNDASLGAVWTKELYDRLQALR
ncbi:MAG TPA: sialic acid TRAP transporter substrate-binding protein SiaP [Thermodesulfobacteriota bacterium]|nr:sialic acid TRAP transporter substrate-binding protein SiaP [Thermodesulfobacteriota bacterium]